MNPIPRTAPAIKVPSFGIIIRPHPYQTSPLALRLLKLFMEFRHWRTSECPRKLEMRMHRLVVSHILLKIKRVFLVDGRCERSIGFLRTLPRRPFIIQVAGVTLFLKLKILPGLN